MHYSIQWHRFAVLFSVVFMLFFASGISTAQEAKVPVLSDHVISKFGGRPFVPDAALSEELQEAVVDAFLVPAATGGWGRDQEIALNLIATSGDPRLGWLISDLMRFSGGGALLSALADASSELLGFEHETGNVWGETTDRLIAWRIPAPPNYLSVKKALFTSVEPQWEKIFVDGNIDWTLVSWGGVLIDSRPYNTTDDRCNCIPAADNPEVISAATADWLEDDDVVFGVEINGEYRAYPRQIMEVREMVNDTLGGRDIGMPYCTLCGAAQAYFTDELPAGVERPVLRTSGLLSRSNKVMYDLTTWSVFDTFTGAALTGPLADISLQLQQASVVTTTWSEWKKAHPNTTVLAEYLALGRDPDFRNNRDANGPIFPVGDVDPRLAVHEDIIGVITSSGKPYAFQRSAAFIDLKQNKKVGFENVQLVLDGGGIRAVDTDGRDLGSHQAFWFAWSQFHPQTGLWPTN